MKEKHLYRLAGVFVLLLIISFVTKPKHSTVNIDELVQNIIIGVAKEDVRSIEVYKETSSEQPIQMAFMKNKDQWHIPTKHNCKAQNSKIDKLLEDIIEMTGKVRSTDPKHHEKYKITDAEGIHFLIKDEGNKSLANIIIGKKSEDQNSGFIRFNGKEKVYAVDKSLLSMLNITGEVDTLSMFNHTSFINLNAVKQDKEKLEMVGLVTNGKQMVIKQIEKEVEVINEDSTKSTKKEKEWVLVQGKNEIELDQKEVSNFLSDVTSIKAEKVVDRIGGNPFGDVNKNSKYGLSNKNVIVFKEYNQQQKNIVMGKEYEKDKGYFMNVQYEALVYHLNKSNYDKMFKWAEELPTKVKKDE